MKQLIKRASTGAVYIGLIIASLLLKEHWLFTILFSAILALALNEFYGQITVARQIHVKTTNIYLDIFGALATFVASSVASLPVAAATFMLYSTTRLIVTLYTREKDPIASLSLCFFAHCYITLPLCALAMLHNIGQYITLAMFVFIWASDTGAYCVGCTMGRHKLFERISPKKSWEGFFGGLILCAILGAVTAFYFGNNIEMSITGCAIFASLVAIFATLGDLVESLLKRSLGIKDFGNILPGHGGILDRIDSLLLVAPASLLCILIIKYL